MIKWFIVVGLYVTSVPDDYKINPGAVEAIAEQPGNTDKILIGYNRGLIVLWDRKNPGAEQVHKINHVMMAFSSNIHFGIFNVVNRWTRWCFLIV